MKTWEEFRDFFNREILEDLQELDRRIAAVNRKLLIWRILTGLGVVLIILFYSVRIFEEVYNTYSILFLFFFTSYFFLTSGQKKEEAMLKIYYRYKWQILPYALENVFENVKYIPNQFISLKAIKESKIFGEYFNFESGEDYFKCEIDDIVLQFSEISLTDTPILTSPRHFDGIFFVSEFNKNFNTNTIILPKSPFSIGKSIYGWMSDLNEYKEVHLEDPRFNDEFIVYAEDQVESRFILTPSFMQHILNLKAFFNSDIVVSFAQQRLNIFIEKDQDLFEPPLNGNYADFDAFYRNISYFKQFTSIVEELKLNVNIWGKQ